jgi:phosphate:Na+ symporter
MENMVVLDLMGGVALLLWGLNMVRSGIMRAFGSDLRRVATRFATGRGRSLPVLQSLRCFKAAPRPT